MRAVFADTCYWIALLNPRDQTHDIAIRVSKGLRAHRIVTTDEVLTEFLNYFGMTDCISMEAMRREGLSEVLTSDEHFTQEGFTCLLER